MRKVPVMLAAALLVASLFAVPTLADPSGDGLSIPPKQEQALINASSDQLPGDMAALKRELAYHSSIRYRILVVDDSGGMDKTDYLDQVAEAWGEPAPDTLLLVVFAQDNYDIRFYMGSNFRQMGATVDTMLKTVRTAYFPLSQKGNVAGGLARLLSVVSDEYSESMHFPVVDKGVPADELQAVTSWVNRYLVPFYDRTQPDKLRLASAGLTELRASSVPDGRLYKVVFSVKPAAPGSDWLAGSGQPDANGYVQQVKVVKVGKVDGMAKVVGVEP